MSSKGNSNPNYSSSGGSRPGGDTNPPPSSNSNSKSGGGGGRNDDIKRSAPINIPRKKKAPTPPPIAGKPRYT
ncbi:hypothetical protein AAE478_000452 [Parahypoxylon ruwenzoriense]